jgi:hypothetical protein
MKHKAITILIVPMILLGLAIASAPNAIKANIKESMRPMRNPLTPTIIVTNNYYDLTVEDAESGRGTYTVCTGDSHPATIQMGSKQNVLYGGASHSPWSTYLSIKSYSSERIYVTSDGNPTPDPGFITVDLGSYGTVTQQSPTSVLSSWTINLQPDSLKIDQLTYIEGTQLEDSRIGVHTKIKNLGSTSVSLGIRYEWDIMIDGNDGATFREKNPQGSWLVYETDWANFTYTHYEITNDSLTPDFFNLGSVIGPAYFEPQPSEPDLLQFADWPDSYGTAYGYTTTGQYIYDDDSAILYYWGNSPTDAINIAPGDSVAVIQYLFASLISLEYQVDNQIKNSFETDYIGDDIYNLTGEDQTKSQTTTPYNAAIYHVKIENDGNGEDGFLVTGPAGSSGWDIAYFDELVGGNNITAQVTGAGWQTGGLNPEEDKEIRVEVMPDNTVPDGDSLVALVLATSLANSQKQDAVKTVTINSVTTIHDVGVTTILAPLGNIPEGATVTPTALAENFGTETETFMVVFEFSSLVLDQKLVQSSILSSENIARVNTAHFQADEAYSDTMMVTLAAGEMDTVEFTPWTAVIGTYDMMSYSMLDGDENPENDTAYGRFVVIPSAGHDVGVLEILEPLGTIIGGSTVIPTAVVKNFGGFYENFWVFFNIGCIYSDFRYMGLDAGAVDTVMFDPWLAVVGYYNEEAVTYLETDENPANDAVDEWLTVDEPSDGFAGKNVPANFALFKPYPNPTANRIAIGFGLPNPSNVELSIYNINGVMVKELVSETRAPGYYRIDTDLRGLGNGVYIVKMKADQFEARTKFIKTN